MRTLEAKEWLEAVAREWKEIGHQRVDKKHLLLRTKDLTSFRVELIYNITFNLSWVCGPGSR